MFHIVKSKSKLKPFTVVLVAENGEPLSSHPLKTKQACFKNVCAQVGEMYSLTNEPFGDVYAYVQDDTAKKAPLVYKVTEFGHSLSNDTEVKPRYIPGRNPKKKK